MDMGWPWARTGSPCCWWPWGPLAPSSGLQWYQLAPPSHGAARASSWAGPQHPLWLQGQVQNRWHRGMRCPPSSLSLGAVLGHRAGWGLAHEVPLLSCHHRTLPTGFLHKSRDQAQCHREWLMAPGSFCASMGPGKDDAFSHGRKNTHSTTPLWPAQAPTSTAVRSWSCAAPAKVCPRDEGSFPPSLWHQDTLRRGRLCLGAAAPRPFHPPPATGRFGAGQEQADGR